MKYLLTLEDLKQIVESKPWENSLVIDMTKLDDELQRVSQNIAEYGYYLSVAEAFVRSLDRDSKILYAALYTQKRQEALSKGEKVTEHQLENAVMLCEEWKDMQTKLIEARFVRDVLSEVLDSFKNKAIMLNAIVRRNSSTVL